MFNKELQANYNWRFNNTPYYQKMRYESSQRYSGSDLTYGDIFGRDAVGYDAFDNDIAKVHIYFKTPTAFKIRGTPFMSATLFVSNIGGIFGLVLGMSIVTLFELVWLCFFAEPL